MSIFSELKNKNTTKPGTDPNFVSGFNFAQSLSGGMPFDQVVQPGLLFSQQFPMGISQKDMENQKKIDKLREDFPQGMPKAPTKQLPSAPNLGFVQEPMSPIGTPAVRPSDFSLDKALENIDRGKIISNLVDTGSISLFSDIAPVMPPAPTQPMSIFDTPIQPSIPEVFNLTPQPVTNVQPLDPTPQPISTPFNFVSPTNIPINVDSIVNPIRAGRNPLLNSFLPQLA